MLVAGQIDKGFGKDVRFEVTFSDAPVGVINTTRRWFETDNQRYQIVRSGFLSARQELKRDGTLIATAGQQMFRNHDTLSFGGREWTFKATKLLATAFGLFDHETQVGAVTSDSTLHRLECLRADLPDELPREIQMFLLAIFIDVLNQPG